MPGTIRFALGEAFKYRQMSAKALLFQEWTLSSQAWGPYEILKSRRTQTSTKRKEGPEKESLVNDA